MGQIDHCAEVREFLSSNTTRFLYLDTAVPEFFVDWDRVANEAAAVLRLEAGRHPHDQALIELIGELSTRSEIFPKRRASHDVQFPRSGQSRRPPTRPDSLPTAIDQAQPTTMIGEKP